MAPPKPDSPTTHRVELFAVQAAIDFDSYRSIEQFEEMILRQARRIDALRARDSGGGCRYPALAVWPENIGTFLALAGRAEDVWGSTTTEAAMRKVVLRELPRVAVNAIRYRARTFFEAIYLTVAPDVHRILFVTFSRVAREFDLWVVAGSALLPGNKRGVDTSEFQPIDARTYNVSYTFDPDGHCVAATRKVNLVPTQEDVIGLTPGRVSDLGVVDTPFGRLGTLICYDGFNEAHTTQEPEFTPGALVLDGLGVDIIAQPSANAWPWDAPWVFNEEGEHLLRSEQWFSEGLVRSMQDLQHVRYAVNPQLVGTIFDNHFEAPSLIFARGEGDAVEILAQAEDPTAADILLATVPVPTSVAEPAASGAHKTGDG